MNVFRVNAQAPLQAATLFDPSELTFEPRSTACGNAAVVLRRHADGSPLHVMVCGLFEAGEVVLSPEPLTQPVLTLEDMLAAAPAARVQWGDLDVDLTHLLHEPTEITVQTPSMLEAWFYDWIDDLLVGFQVRLYRGGIVWVNVIAHRAPEFRQSATDNTGVFEQLTVTIGDATVCDEAVTLYANAGAAFARFIGDAQYPHALHYDTDRLQRLAVLPTMGFVDSVDRHRLDELTQAYTPFHLGDYKVGMASGGVTKELGPITGWAARWLASGGDARAWRAIMANARATAHYPLCWRRADFRMVIPSDYPAQTYNGSQNGASMLVNDGVQLDRAHNPEMWVAYAFSADSYLRDLMLGNIAAMYLISPVNGEGTAKKIQRQPRGTAWFIRAVAMAAAILPDDHYALEDMRELLWTQIAAGLRYGPDDCDSTLGYPWASVLNRRDKPVWAKPWMYDFWAWAVSMASRTDALRGERKTEAQRLARWMLQGVVGRIGTCPDYMAPYSVRVSDKKESEVYTVTKAAHLYPSWEALRAANYPEHVCQHKILENGSTHPDGPVSHFKQMLPAIAEAFAQDVPGIKAAWDTVRAASNYIEDIWTSDYQYGPWGVSGPGQELLPLMAPDVPPVVTEPETPAPETPEPETPAPETPAPETPAPVAPDTNRFRAIPGTSSADMEALHRAQGFDFKTAVYRHKYTGSAKWAHMLNAWSAGAFDPVTGIYWIALAGGHGDGSFNGVAGYATDTQQWVIARLPSDPNAPDARWSEDYRRLVTGAYSKYPLPGFDPDTEAGKQQFTDTLPDGTPTARHIYGSIVIDPDTRVLYVLRGAIWAFNLPDHPSAPGQWTKRPFLDAVTGQQLYTSEGNINWWDRLNRGAVGTFGPKSKTDQWGFCDCATGRVTWIKPPLGGLLNPTMHGCEIDDDLIVLKAWDRKVKTRERYAVYSRRAMAWAHYGEVSGEIIDYTLASATSWRQSSLNEMIPAVTLPGSHEILLRTQAGGNRGKWWVFDHLTGVQRRVTVNGKVPVGQFIGKKLFSDGEKIVVITGIEAGDMVYECVGNPVVPADATEPPVSPPVDPPVDPPADPPVDPPVEPLPPVEPEPDLAALEARLIAHERRLESLEQAYRKLKQAWRDAP